MDSTQGNGESSADGLDKEKMDDEREMEARISNSSGWRFTENSVRSPTINPEANAPQQPTVISGDCTPDSI